MSKVKPILIISQEQGAIKPTIMDSKITQTQNFHMNFNRKNEVSALHQYKEINFPRLEMTCTLEQDYVL